MDPTTTALYLAVSRYVTRLTRSCDGGIARWRVLTEALAAFEAAHPEACAGARTDAADRADGAG